MDTLLPKKIAIFIRIADESDACLREFFSRLRAQRFAGEQSWVLVYTGLDSSRLSMLKGYEPDVLAQMEPSDVSLGALFNWAIASTPCDWVLALKPGCVRLDTGFLESLLRRACGSYRVGGCFVQTELNRRACTYDAWLEDILEPRDFGLRECNLDACLVHKRAWRYCKFRQDLECAEGYVWAMDIAKRRYSVELVFQEESVSSGPSERVALQDCFWNARAEACAVTYALYPDCRWPCFWSMVVRGLLRDLARGGRFFLPKLQGFQYMEFGVKAFAARAAAYVGALDGAREASKRAKKSADALSKLH